MDGLFFRHHLVVRASTALGLSPYIGGLLRDCLSLPERFPVSPGFTSPEVLRDVVLERPRAIPQRGRNNFREAGRGHGTCPPVGLVLRTP